VRSTRIAFGLLCLSAAVAAWGAFGKRGLEVEFTPEEVREILHHSPLAPPPADLTNRVADNPAAARFGQALFFDGRLSANGRVACATCHDPAWGWSNGQRRGEGLGITARHVPALWNVAYNRWYFWDGRADSLWSQALQPIEAPNEIGGDRVAIAHTLAADPTLRSAYEGVFGALPDLSGLPAHAKPVRQVAGDPLQAAWEAIPGWRRILVNRVFSDVGKSIEAYERRIVSHHSPFDTFAEGLRTGDRAKRRVLSISAQLGLKLFVGRGNCILCHSGPNFSDGEFHNLRLPQDTSLPLDTGRYEGVRELLQDEFNSIGTYSDHPAEKRIKYLVARADSWGQFKTPTLRNVAQTPPYTHDGTFASLEEVVRFYSTLKDAAPMGHHDESILKPLHLSEQEIADLVAFLSSLSGEPFPFELQRPLNLAGRSAGPWEAFLVPHQPKFPLPATRGGRSRELRETVRLR